MHVKYAIALIVIGLAIYSDNDKFSSWLVGLYYRRTGGRRISYVSTLKFNFALSICLIVVGGLMLLWLLVRTT